MKMTLFQMGVPGFINSITLYKRRENLMKRLFRQSMKSGRLIVKLSVTGDLFMAMEDWLVQWLPRHRMI